MPKSHMQDKISFVQLETFWWSSSAAREAEITEMGTLSSLAINYNYGLDLGEYTGWWIQLFGRSSDISSLWSNSSALQQAAVEE